MAQGRQIIESKFFNGLGPSEDIFGRWFDWLIARILLREATSLIEGPPSGNSKLKPEPPMDR